MALALGLALVPSTASPAGVLILHGSHGSSHPRFAVAGSSLVLHKRQGMRFPGGSGCRNTHPGFRCPLGSYGRVEIIMGPSDDKVEIESPMPVPVTVHLGSGSDKFIGNDEPDTCYSEGSKRNRCIGGGGNDVCITGDRNSDCVGGPGRDFCKHGDGSDGCWGGPGDDVCVMGAGQDGCHGGPATIASSAGREPTSSTAGPGATSATAAPASAARTAARRALVTEGSLANGFLSLVDRLGSAPARRLGSAKKKSRFWEGS